MPTRFKQESHLPMLLPTSSRADPATHYTWGDGCDGWRLLETPGLRIREERMPPGNSERPHRHLSGQQAFYVLSGVLLIRLADDTRRLGPGDLLGIPAGVAHEVRNESGEPTRFLVITAPAVEGDREEIGSLAGNASASAGPVLIRPATTSDRGALHALFTDSWLTFWAPHLPPEAEVRFRAEDPVARFLDASLDRIEVAELGPDVVGAIRVEDDCLEDLHVAREFQGRGIGLRLLRQAEALGSRHLEVRAFNERAIRFYERAGWMRRRTYPTTEMGFPTLSHEYVAPLK
ncbi:GNAT family N-acetyltransferase [Roseibacterium sp. SDUM158017]|uniref:GNAT family N-acetyltransferase n=1 Tax=Roseicyclus salinarum TaxID=3036773 RepID=UPI0024156C09|nr:GNAT family N-acetyltransferase [Roseibacterium sp. SDUM158017]MDG4650375.1 GNAT family N-acetyltransferase [Roseibacterium sp. SDUM158017]